MSRVRRLTYASAYYHVITRGTNRRVIFLDTEDYSYYLRKVAKYSKEFESDILAFALIPNHTHLLIHTPCDTLSQMMKSLNTSYAIYFNRRYNRTGHLFQGRFKSIIVDKNKYLLEVNRYIHLQALKAGIVKNLGNYPWTSYREYIGESHQYPWIKKEYVLSQFKSIDEFITFTKERIEGETLEITSGKIGYFYGAKDFAKRIEERLENRKKQRIRRGRRKREWHMTPEILEKKIIEITLSFYGAKKITEIIPHSKKSEVARRCKVLSFLLKKYAKLYNYEIGRIIRRDKSAISKYLDEVNNAEPNSQLWQDINNILDLLSK